MQRPTHTSFPPIANLRTSNPSELVKTWLSIQNGTTKKNFAVRDSFPDIYHRTPSITDTLSSSSSTRHSSFLVESSSTSRFRTRTNAVPASESGLATRFAFVELHSSLSEDDRKRLDEIRQQIPDEFERFLPTFLRLGLVLWPKQFFNEEKQLTSQQIRQRDHFLDILEADRRDEQEHQQLQRLYGGISATRREMNPHLLRENLSHQGQLSLVAAYRDEIERELTAKIRYWKFIPMKPLRDNLSDDSLRVSFFQPNSKKTKKPPMIIVTDKLDEQWQRKVFGKIIERGMNILDDVRNVREHNDPREEQIIRAFKRWIFLWTTLFQDEQ